jgi:hypothetical protein
VRLDQLDTQQATPAKLNPAEPSTAPVCTREVTRRGTHVEQTGSCHGCALENRTAEFHLLEEDIRRDLPGQVALRQPERRVFRVIGQRPDLPERQLSGQLRRLDAFDRCLSHNAVSDSRVSFVS